MSCYINTEKPLSEHQRSRFVPILLVFLNVQPITTLLSLLYFNHLNVMC